MRHIGPLPDSRHCLRKPEPHNRMRANRLTIAFLLLVLGACASSGPRVYSPSAPVYSLAIDHVFAHELEVARPKTVSVLRTTEVLDGCPTIANGDSAGVADSVPISMQTALCAMFKDSVTLGDQDLPAGARWRSSRGGRRGAVTLSPVVFSADSSAALVYAAIRCGPVCGGGDVLFLRSTGPSTWRVVEVFPWWR